jgi:UDP:flavonoid glycosyltransferase YjiC (YdhE family)
MKVLFAFEGGAGAILPLVPLAHAVRGAGHAVIAAAHAEFVPILLGAGVPAVAAPRKAPRDYRVIRDGKLQPLTADLDERAGVLGAIGAQIAADGYHELLELVERWRPDIIVGGPLAYVAPLLSSKLGVPHVAVEFGMAEPLNWHLATLDELARLGFAELPPPAGRLVLCPESVRPNGTPDTGPMRYLPATPLRYVPYATARPVEPWMYDKGHRPRVWVSAGSRVSADYALDHLMGLIRAAAELDVELLIATPDDVAERLGADATRGRVGWLPFDVLAPTCDLAVHPGGGSTMLGCLAHAIPQVIIPYMPEAAVYAEPLRAYGAAKLLDADVTGPADILAACQEVLAEPEYRRAADRLRAELVAAPGPAATVVALEEIASAARRTVGV